MPDQRLSSPDRSQRGQPTTSRKQPVRAACASVWRHIRVREQTKCDTPKSIAHSKPMGKRASQNIEEAGFAKVKYSS